MQSEQFQEFLKKRLQDPLPGRPAQQKMVPHPVNGSAPLKKYEPANDDFRDNSVLVPVIGWKDELEVLFTLRTASINHGGQLSFPGGGKEGNESKEETALREAQEEIGLRPENVSVVGELTPLYVGHSDNMVTPVVAILHHKQTFTPNPNEVDEIISVPLKDFITGEHLVTQEWQLRNNMPYKVPFWDIHRVPLWGATAMMMNELVELYKEFLTKK